MSRGRPLDVLIRLSVVLACVVCLGRAEELTLHDGQKIAGTIVGFENDMFKVETEFGFALVRKDRVKSISFPASAAAKKDEPRKTLAEDPVKESASGREAGGTPQPTAPQGAILAEAKSAPPPRAVSRPIDQPLPVEIRERMEGTTYVNETFQFSFFKPPGWKIHENAPRETGRAIVAIGPENEHTLLLVDRQVWSGAPNLQIDPTELQLRRTYQKYRILSETTLQLDSRAAVRREFEGELDGALWRGIAVRVAEGNTVFGLIGLTSSETLQFHEAVLNKIIGSFRFLAPTGPAPAHR